MSAFESLLDDPTVPIPDGHPVVVSLDRVRAELDAWHAWNGSGLTADHVLDLLAQVGVEVEQHAVEEEASVEGNRWRVRSRPLYAAAWEAEAVTW